MRTCTQFIICVITVCSSQTKVIFPALDLAPIPGPRPQVKRTARGEPASEEVKAAHLVSVQQFTGRCLRFASGGDINRQPSKEYTLTYRRGGDPGAVLATDHARRALDEVFETGIDEVLATISQVAMMDCKVSFCTKAHLLPR